MIQTLYEGKVKIEFNESNHSYWLLPKRERLLGVTTVTGIIDKSTPLVIWATGLAHDHLISKVDTLKELSPDQAIALIKEACGLHRVKKESAANTGSAIHDWIHRFISEKKTPPLPKDPQVLHGVNAFLEWTDQHKVKFITSERLVYSKKYNYVGTMDAEAIIDGKRCLVDYKSSKSIYSSFYYQTAAYQAADEEESGKPYMGNRWLIKLGKDDGQFEAHECPDFKADFKTFLACLTVKRREKELSKY